tara:strand:- start:205 stop:720 length:516 start_codon:yes stop_codon:yes gene_type:complete
MLYSVGCQTTVGDPSRGAQASTMAILMDHDTLKSYIVQRRAVLSQLQSELVVLNDELLAQNTELRLLEKALERETAETAISDEERQALEEKVAKLRVTAGEAYERMLITKNTADRLTQQRIDSDAQAESDREAIDTVQHGVERLGREVTALDKAVDRTLNLRSSQILRQAN